MSAVNKYKQKHKVIIKILIIIVETFIRIYIVFNAFCVLTRAEQKKYNIFYSLNNNYTITKA